MSSSNKIDLYQRQVLICMYCTSPLLHTVRTCTYSQRGGRVDPERRGEGQHITKLVWKYQHDWMHARDWLSLINTCRKVLLQINFLDDNILHCLLWVLSFYGAQSAGQSKHRTDRQENCKIGIQECCIGYHGGKEVAISIAFTTIYIWDWISLYLHISWTFI
jgi:hypothetical protein